MGQPLRYVLPVLLTLGLLLAGARAGLAEPTLEETKQLLQKGLTLVELDQEIARLSVRETKVGEEIAKTEEQITENQKDVARTREHAAKVLRAYYMGDRDNLWMMLLSAKSLSEALAIYEYMSMILDNDHHTLGSYSESYQTLTASKTKLETEKQQLAEVKASFVAQRERAVEVQRQIDEALAASADAEILKEQLNAFVNEWKEQGIPLFRTYLNAMSLASQSLPELLLGENAKKYAQTDLAKRTMSFAIPDTDLTAFYRSKQPILENITLKVDNGQFQAEGTDNGIFISLTGHYTVENEPVNQLKFHVDQLRYKDYTLPDTSNRSLEEEFNLGFIPSRFIKDVPLEVTEVTQEGGTLSLKLKLN